jgi:hypothetical protein
VDTYQWFNSIGENMRDNTLVDQLELIKHLPVYAVALRYGEGPGCDDIDEDPSKRYKFMQHQLVLLAKQDNYGKLPHSQHSWIWILLPNL